MDFEAHTFKKGEGKHDNLILIGDFMQSIGLNLFYITIQFQRKDIKVAMVPRGFWSKRTMSGFQFYDNNKI